MADSLIFPVKFDLEAAVRKAQGDADKYLRQLQTTIHSKPLAIDLKIVNAGSGSLNEISKRMRDIVVEWNNMSEAERIASKTSGEYTDRAKKLIAEFARLTGASETYARSLQQIVAASRRAANEQEKAMEKQRKTQAILLANEKSIANITAKLKYWKEVMNSSDIGSKQFRKAAEEVRRLNQSLGEAQRNVNSLTGQFRKQDGYVKRLVKRLVVYAGFQQINNFLTSVRSVTAEFELQRISLGAIIQDQAKANALFSEIKNFALKSPIKILDLTKYTKQLAAYKIGVNELFDTTKRLADISVGIGVSMDRLILLYGQVRATGYLRASEIRQATEAGIPLVEELANKLSEVNGTLVTSAQVLKMVENRAISFEMVKEVFEDMTNAGGLFYDMQEKQGNTLYGMWQKLGDAAAMMYDEIGNTPWVNEGMKEGINMLRTLMLEWKLAGANITTLGVAMLLYANKTKIATLATKLNTAANTEGATILRGRILHLKKAIMYQNLFATSTTAATTATKLFTLAQLRLTQALNLLAVGFKKLSAAFMKNIWGIALVGLSLLIEHLIFAKDQAKELKNELANINLDYESKQGQDAANLEYLANAAINAAKGSKAQKDALEELKNTYGKIIPMELLTIENLERMKGNYGELIAIIDEYNLKQKYEKEKSAIESSFAPKEEERANKIRNILRDGLRLDYADEATGGVFDKTLELSERNIQRFLLNLKKYADEGLDKKEQIIRASADLAAELGLNEGETEALTKAMVDLDRGELEGQGTLMDYTEALHQKHEAMEEVTNDYEKQKKALNEYSAVVDEVLKKNEEEPEVTANKDEFENEKARLNNQISDVASGIVELLNKANVAVDNGTQQILNTVIQNGGMIPDAVWDILEKAAEAANNPKLLAAIQDLRKHYKGIAPDDETVNFVKNGFIRIVSAAQGQMKEYRQYLYDGKTTIKEYQDFLQKSIQGLRAQIFQMVRLNNLIDAGLVEGQKYDEATIKALQEKADNLQTILDQFVTPLVMPDEKSKTSRGGTKSDPRLQILNEMVQLAEKLNKEYSDWEKKVGSTHALEKVNNTYKETVKYAEQVAKDAGIKLPHLKSPTNAKELNQYLDAVRKVMETAKGLKGGKKAAIELAVKISDNVSAEDQKAIEAKIKALADRISRTKTAKEFYEKILSQTGDVELAADMTVSIYGQTGQGLQKEIATQLGNALRGVTAEGETIGVNVFEEGVIDPTTFYINYTKLREIVEKQGGKLSESQKKILDDMLKNGEAYNKAQVEQWAKDLAKVKDYTDQYIDLYRMTEQRKAEIRAKMKSGELDKDAGKQEIAGYDAKLAKEQQKLQYEAFKNSPMYTSLFENMENATVQSLHNMRSQIEKMMAVTKEPTQLKELQSRLNEIDDTLAEKSPFEVIAKGWQTMGKMAEKYGSRSNLDNLIKQKQDELDALQAELDAALKKKAQAKQFAEMVGVDVQTPATAITPVQKAALAAYQQASADVKKYGDAVKKADNEQQKLTSDATKWANAMGKVKKGLKTIIQIGQNLLKASEAAQEFAEALGMSEDGLELFQDINNVISNTLNFADALIGCIDLMAKTTAQSISTVEKASVILTVISAALQVATAIFNLFGNAKVRKANKEIERQQELLDQLEYTYGRLEKAADKAFGADFVANQKQQQKILLAQQQAYMKQYEAEMSKGKKADKEKAQEFLDKARDVGDQIAEMQSQIAERMTGTDVTSAARDFASAWLEAYATFGNTTDAIKEKFNDMIKNMIVESVMAKVVQNALQPMFDEMNEMYKEGASMTEVLSFAFRESAQLSKDIDNGLTVAARQLEAAGIDIKSLYASSDNITGISRDFATASESSINGLAAMYNTEIHHTSYLPVISANVEIMRQLMEARIPSASTTDYGVNWTDWQNQAMDHYRAIRQYTYETAQRCERAAAACEAISEKFGRAFTTKGSSQGFNVFLKQ